MKTLPFDKRILFALFLYTSCFISCTKDKSSVIPETPDVVTPEKPVISNELPYPIDSTFNVKAIASGESERIRLNQSFKPSDFFPTGWFAESNTKITVNVSLLQGAQWPELIIGTYNRNGHSTNPQTVSLAPGNNVINVTHAGLIYIRYSGTNAETCRIKLISGMVPAPIYKAGKTTKDDWKGMLNNYSKSSEAVLFGDKIIIVLSRRVALDNISYDQEKLLSNANKIWQYEEEYSGLDNSSPKHAPNVHNHLMTEYLLSDYYMAAYNFGTFYNANDAIQVLVDPNQINTWGPWHELGHHHQQKAYQWTGLTEVTVNLYSLYVEKRMGATSSRLKTGNHWSKIKAYLNLSSTSKNYDSIEDVFVKLGMFHQLTLSFGDNLYKSLHKITREELANNVTDFDKKRYFMLKVCEITQTDLSQFFKDWGMVGVDQVYAEIAALNLSEPKINPSTLQE